MLGLHKILFYMMYNTQKVSLRLGLVIKDYPGCHFHYVANPTNSAQSALADASVILSSILA